LVLPRPFRRLHVASSSSSAFASFRSSVSKPSVNQPRPEPEARAPQPMGFYAPAQLVRDAREHSVGVRPVDVNRSQWDCTLEKTAGRYHAVRLGFCMVRSLRQTDTEQLVDRRTYDRIAASRAEKTFTTIEDVWRRAGVPMALSHRGGRWISRSRTFATRCGLGDQRLA
jgi:hypothetical protein